MGQITKATRSIYKAGDVVTVTDTGQCYTTYRDMVSYLGLANFEWGKHPLAEGDKVTVIASAMHESVEFGEVVAVRTADGKDALIGARGISEPIIVKDENGADVLGYDRAILVTNDEDLLKAAVDAPEWALYVAQDDYGIWFFDHHPYVLNRTNLVRGLLPETHKFEQHGLDRSTQIKALRLADAEGLDSVIIGTLRKQLAETKAKLFNAEQKLNRIKGIVE